MSFFMPPALSGTWILVKNLHVFFCLNGGLPCYCYAICRTKYNKFLVVKTSIRRKKKRGNSIPLLFKKLILFFLSSSSIFFRNFNELSMIFPPISIVNSFIFDSYWTEKKYHWTGFSDIYNIWIDQNGNVGNFRH